MLNLKKFFESEPKDPVAEAERYLRNAKQILSEKAKKDGDFYHDRKYVKMAGHTAWCGVLVALDGALGVKDSLKKNQRPEFKDYQDAVYKRDRKMAPVLLAAYETLHKSLGYDGNPSYDVCRSGIKLARRIIEWSAQQCKTGATGKDSPPVADPTDH
jgi:hypothetical protein